MRKSKTFEKMEDFKVYREVERCSKIFPNRIVYAIDYFLSILFIASHDHLTTGTN